MMIKTKILLCMLFSFTFLTCEAQLSAFPGAKGYGKYSVGGRGGDVIFVTNLNDSGAGSLRSACLASGPRTIIFKTGGTITLNNAIVISNPNITIAGQTAPGGGICLKMNSSITTGNLQAPLVISTDHVIIRGMRFRAGPSNPGLNVQINDCLDIWSGENIIIDHCSFTWGEDETLTIWSDNLQPKKITIQKSIIGQGLQQLDANGAVGGYGMLVGGTVGATEVSIVDNLFIHNMQRNPFLKSEQPSIMNMYNNVNYNYGYFGTDLAEDVQVDLISNYYKAGNNTATNRYEVLVNGQVSLYANDNIGLHRDNSTLPEWDIVGFNGFISAGYCESPAPLSFQSTVPFTTIDDNISSSQAAYNNLITTMDIGANYKLDESGSGAYLPNLDAVDAGLINDLINNTGQAIFDTDIGTTVFYPVLAAGNAPLDADNDGMPDLWENTCGLNAANPNDRNNIATNGYTNLENYLNNVSCAPGIPTCTAVETTAPACDGNSGAATASVQGGTSPYTFLWNDPQTQTTATANGLTAGTYTVIVTDANNFTTQCAVTLTNPSNLSCSIVETTPPSPGGSDGVATVTPNGGSGSTGDPRTDLLASSDRNGYGKDATGGTNYVYVNNYTELKNALQTAGNYVLLDPSLAGQGIGFTNTINPASNTTLDGSLAPGSWFFPNYGAGYPANTTMMNFFSTNNCIIHSIEMRGNRVTPYNANHASANVGAFNVRGSLVWFDHVTITDFWGQSVMIAQGGDNISLSNMKIINTVNGLWMNFPNDTPRHISLFNSEISAAQNTPYNEGASHFHMWNNYIHGAQYGGSMAGVAQNNAAGQNGPVRTLSENNVFSNNNPYAEYGFQTGDNFGGPVQIPGYIYSNNCIYKNGDATNGNVLSGNAPWTIPYSYTLMPANQVEAYVAVNAGKDSGGGGVTTYTYQWDGPAAQTTAVASGLAAGTYSVTVTDGTGCSTVCSVTMTGAPVICNINVWLEGAYDENSGNMENNMQQLGLLPAGQPYNSPPWNYPGNEGSGWQPGNYPSGAVDWVILTLRETDQPDTEVGKGVGLLMQDGSIQNAAIELTAPAVASYYIVVEHRNHLPAMSPSTVPLVNNALTYDFRATNSYAQGGSGQKQIGNQWLMYAGNLDYSSPLGYEVTGEDIIPWQVMNGNFGAYRDQDANLDGDVNGQDKIVVSLNNGVFSAVKKSSIPVECDNSSIPNTVFQCPTSNAIAGSSLSIDLSVGLPSDASSILYQLINGNGQIQGSDYVTGNLSAGTHSFEIERCYTLPNDKRTRLLNSPNRVGYGASATGGTNYVFPTNEAEFRSMINQDGNYVCIGSNYANTEWGLTNVGYIGSNITIDASDAPGFALFPDYSNGFPSTAAGNSGAAVLSTFGQDNIIVHSLILKGYRSASYDSSDPSYNTGGMNIRSSNVFIDHVEITNFWDDAIYTAQAGDYVTLSHLKIHNTDKGMMVWTPFVGEWDRHVTLHSSYLAASERNPWNTGGHYFHFFNNFVENSTWQAMLAGRATSQGGFQWSGESYTISENNVYQNSGASDMFTYTAPNTVVGFVESVNDSYDSTSGNVSFSSSPTLFTIDYDYSGILKPTSQVAAYVLQNAGELQLTPVSPEQVCASQSCCIDVDP